MNAKNRMLKISVVVIALFAGLSVARTQIAASDDILTAISNLENDAVKAIRLFIRKFLAEDWTWGDSDGTYFTKAVLLNLMADKKSIKINSENLSELKVRVRRHGCSNLQGHL
jgi:hypothetical protein